MLIKVLAEETTLNAATNVGSATVVRLYNGHSAALLITRKILAMQLLVVSL